MKFLDIFSYVLIAFVFFIASALVGMTELWTPSLGSTVSWILQSLGLAFLVVGGTCTVCQKPVKELCPWSVFWVIFSVGFVMLLSITLSACKTSTTEIWPEAAEFVFFLGFLIMLFTLPRSYYYD